MSAWLFLRVAVFGMGASSLVLLVGCAGASNIAVTEQADAAPVSEGETAVRAEITEAFSELACRMAPVPVYAPMYLPQESALADLWWPVLATEQPEGHGGPPASNPQITSAGPEVREAQVVVKVGGGWLLFLENFRGDLGDVRGRPVGTVGLHAATLFEVNGGTAVQWSHEGLSYAVFGRALP